MTAARGRFSEHPVALGSFRSWLRLLLHNRTVDAAFLPRALFVTATTLLSSPLRMWESVRHGRAVRDTSVHPEPVFIVGHWRSGTTHLQNLLCQDQQFGFLSTFQAMVPSFCLSGERILKPFLAQQAARRYPTRLIDNIPLTFDAPQEDEFAMAALSDQSFLHGFTFPRRAGEYFDRYVMFEGLSNAEQSDWVQTYLGMLKKVTLSRRGRRLLSKCCAHSARIPTLLQLFPRARFIHIHRNPYDVFASTLHMHKTVFPRSQLQHVSPERIRANVLTFYERLMKRLFDDWETIPPGQRAIVRFEDLERLPMEQLASIYDALRLPGYPAAEAAFLRYLDAVAGYRKNEYRIDGRTIETVNDRWGFAFDALGYKRRTPS